MVNKIGDYAFYGCSNFGPAISFYGHYDIDRKPDSYLQYIGDYAFYGCSSLSSDLIFNSSLNYIGRYAFAECRSFTNSLIMTGNNYGALIHIGNYAFNNTHFETLNYYGIVEPSYEYPIALNDDITINVPSAYNSNHLFYYRNPSFCSHDIVARMQSNSQSSSGINYGVNHELEFTNIDDFKDPDTFRKALQNVPPSNDGTRVLTISLKTNVDPGTHITIPDGLNENDFIQYSGNGIIDYNGKPLNIDISQNKQTNVQIPSNQPSNVVINSKNGGTLSIATDQTSVVLNSTSKIESSQSYYDFSIEVQPDVESVSMEQLVLINKGNVKVESTNGKRLPLDVKNLTTESMTNLEYMNINGPFNVKQTTSVNFDGNVSLDKADINFQLDQLNANMNNPLFTGEIESIPNTFRIAVSDDTVNISEIRNITIFRGKFKCDDWSSKLNNNYPSQYFRKPVCLPESENAKVLEEKEEEEEGIQELILPKDENYVNTYGQLTCKKEKKLSGGAIAGIVIACIVVVAALMVGEFFLVKKMLNNEAPSEKEAEEV